MIATVVYLIMIAFNAVNCLPFVNRCEKIRLMPNFDAQKFQGLWYEIFRTPFGGLLDTTCNTETYTLVNDTELDIVAHFIELGTLRHLTTVRKADIDAKIPSLWHVNFPEVEATGTFRIVSTDYNNYAVIYRCKTFEIFKIETSWLLSRKRTLNEDIKNKVLEVYEKVGANPEELQHVDQETCPD